MPTAHSLRIRSLSPCDHSLDQLPSDIAHRYQILLDHYLTKTVVQIGSPVSADSLGSADAVQSVFCR